jgi:hypothetical protein
VALSATFGKFVAPAGASNVTASVTPAGIGASSCAVIFLDLLLGLTYVYVVELSTTDTGVDPATALCTVIVAGDPDTETVWAPALRPRRSVSVTATTAHPRQPRAVVNP